MDRNEPHREFSGPGYFVRVVHPQPGDRNDVPLNQAINRLRQEMNRSRRALRSNPEVDRRAD